MRLDVMAVAACVSMLPPASAVSGASRPDPRFDPAPASVWTALPGVDNVRSAIERPRLLSYSISPDGSRVAAVILRMSTRNDSYSTAMVLAPLDHANPQIVGSAGPVSWSFVGEPRAYEPRWLDKQTVELETADSRMRWSRRNERAAWRMKRSSQARHACPDTAAIAEGQRLVTSDTLIFFGRPYIERSACPDLSPRPTAAHRNAGERLSKCTDIQARARVVCLSSPVDATESLVAMNADGTETVVAIPLHGGMRATDTPRPEMRRVTAAGQELSYFLYRSREPRSPAVIITYDFSGFMTSLGDEVPIRALLDNGIAVIALHCPELSGQNGERWSTPLAAMTAIVAALSSEDIIDPDRIGISGLSYGAELAHYAVSHSTLFAAAATGGSGVLDPAGLLLADRAGAEAYPEIADWWLDPAKLENLRRLSPALNARAVRAPVLVQASDREAVLAYQFHASLVHAGAPSEMILFENEWHLKVSPRNRYVAALRNLQWFRFWLQGVEAADAADPGQYARWRELRRQLAP